MSWRDLRNEPWFGTLPTLVAAATGWDATVLGQDRLSPGQRVARLDEFVTLTDLLLRQAETTWEGDWFRAEQAMMIPAGIRSDHAGGGGQRSSDRRDRRPRRRVGDHRSGIG